MRPLVRSLTTLGASLAAAATLTWAAPALACGGFFCNNGNPVNQTGEQILFAVDRDAGTIEAHVRIQYQGPSDAFAWIVPTPTRPEVGVSSESVFTRLDQRLRPQWLADYRQVGECDWGGDFFESDAAAGGGGAPTDEDGGGRGVTVVEQSQVGPYDYAILQATDVEVLFEWLQDNDYDIPDVIMPFVEPYVLMGEDMHFVSFKLSKDNDSGDIQPVTLRYESTKPMIPIQLTAVATEPDLGITVHILDQTRSVPENYLHVFVNEARINWLGGGNNYDDLVTAAMDEAGGQGFATEYAGATVALDGALFDDSWFDLDALRTIEDPIAYWNRLMDMLSNAGFRGDAGVLDLLQAYIPVPDDLDAQSFYNCLECYSEYVDAENFDNVGFTDAIEAEFVEPLRHAQELFDTIPYVTRLYTTLSAEDMTVDPVFARNSTMGDVDNVHIAEVIVDCGDGGDYYSSPVTIRLPDGRTILTSWDDAAREELDAMPAADSIERTSGSGAPEPVSSNRDDINTDLEAYNDQMAALFDAQRSPKSGGCAAAPGTAGGLGFAMFGLMLGLSRRRR